MLDLRWLETWFRELGDAAFTLERVADLLAGKPVQYGEDVQLDDNRAISDAEKARELMTRELESLELRRPQTPEFRKILRRAKRLLNTRYIPQRSHHRRNESPFEKLELKNAREANWIECNEPKYGRFGGPKHRSR